MKTKIIALLLALMLALSLVSCGDRDNDKNPSNPGSGIEGPLVDWEPDPQ